MTRNQSVADTVELERKLREAKARLAVAPKASAVLNEAKAIRAWAAKHGIACPAMGRVPADVRQQYEAVS